MRSSIGGEGSAARTHIDIWATVAANSAKRLKFPLSVGVVPYLNARGLGDAGMSVLLYVIGAIAVMVGVGMVGFGIPINEFSFGNTLIGAGFTTATGGLIIIALGVVAGQLHRLGEMLGASPAARVVRPPESMQAPPEAVQAAAAARATMPPRPRAEPPVREPFEARVAPPPAMAEEQPTQSFAPSFAPALRNPDIPPLAVEDEISLSPPHPATGPAPGSDFARVVRPAVPPGANGGAPEQRYQSFQPSWRGPAPAREVPPPNFDNMWPAEPKPARVLGGEPPIAARAERPPREPMAPAPPPAPPPAAGQPRTVAVLKSGVVDGMGYTLYVDGSIEAELPQGTLRFASIEELRSHLEKNS